MKLAIWFRGLTILYMVTALLVLVNKVPLINTIIGILCVCWVVVDSINFFSEGFYLEHRFE